MRKKVIFAVSFFVFIFIATFAFYGVKLYMIKWYTDHYETPAVFVSAAKAQSQTWHPFLTSVGTLKASNGVEVNAQVSGQIESIHFQSGDYVKKGDLLVQLDDAIDQQNLLRDEAQLRLDKLDYDRKKLLMKKNAVARSVLDAARAAYLKDMAAVASDKVMLAKKKIRAPFSGKIGIDETNVGQYMSPGDKVVSLQAMDPLHVDFSLPEQDLPKVYNNQLVEIQVDAYPDEVFKGKITAINSRVDVSTRSIAVQATIPNKDKRLYPGLFANVKITLPNVKDVVTVSQTAITYSLYGDSVYLVKTKGKDKKGKPILIAKQQFIKVGERRGTVASIIEGVKPDEEVVTTGQIKLQPNVRIKINNAIKLK